MYLCACLDISFVYICVKYVLDFTTYFLRMYTTPFFIILALRPDSRTGAKIMKNSVARDYLLRVGSSRGPDGTPRCSCG